LSLKLPDWASIAEIISSVAVVISLIFLIIGVKENTEVTRAATYARNVYALIAFREKVATNDDLAALWLAYETGKADSLGRIERIIGELVFRHAQDKINQHFPELTWSWYSHIPAYQS